MESAFLRPFEKCLQRVLETKERNNRSCDTSGKYRNGLKINDKVENWKTELS